MRVKVKTIKVALGIFTFFTIFFPFIIMPIFFLSFLGNPGNAENFPDAFPIGFFLATIYYSISQLALQVYYIVLVVKNKQLSDSARIVFVVGIFILPYIALPFYFIAHIWKEGSQFIDVLRPKNSDIQSVEPMVDKIKEVKTEIPKQTPIKKNVRKTTQETMVPKKSTRSKK